MYLLFSHDKLSQLPGAAQKILFRMLEEMADTVYKTNQVRDLIFFENMFDFHIYFVYMIINNFYVNLAIRIKIIIIYY